MCYRIDHNQHKGSSKDWAFAAMSFVLICLLAVGLVAIKEAVSSHPSLGTQQIIQAGRTLVETVGR